MFACLARMVVIQVNLNSPPEYREIPVSTQEEKTKIDRGSLKNRSFWALGMLLAGATVGAGVAFFFIGSVQDGASSIARVWLISLIAGFFTPEIIEFANKKIRKSMSGSI